MIASAGFAGLLKWLIGDFIFDTVMGSIFGGLKKMLGPMVGTFTKKASAQIGDKVADKVTEQFFTLLGATELDEEVLLDAFKLINDYNVVSAFARKLQLIADWYAPADKKRAEELKEYIRRIVIQKTVTETAGMVEYFAAMPEDAWREYLEAIDIEHKDIRSKYKFLVSAGQFFKKGTKYGWKYSRRVAKLFWGRTLLPYWAGAKARVQKLVLGTVAILMVLALLGFAAYAFKWMPALIVFLLATIIVLSFIDGVWMFIMRFIIAIFYSFGLIEQRSSLLDLSYRIKHGYFPPLIKGIRVMMIVLATLGTVAAMSPSWLYSYWFWGYATVATFAAIVYITATATPKSYAVKVLGVHYFVLLALMLFPQPVESAMVLKNKFVGKLKTWNIQTELESRPVLTAKGEIKGWDIQMDEFGEPLKGSNGLYTLTPCMVTDKSGNPKQFVLSAEDKYKIDGELVTVDAGELMVRVYTPHSDGTWIITSDTKKCWIPVSKTELASKPTPTPQPVQQQVVVNTQPVQPSASNTPIQSNQARNSANSAASQSVNNGSTEQVKTSHRVSLYVPAKAPYQSSIFVRRGQKITITASGKVNSMPESWSRDGTYRWVGPDGWGKENPGFITQARGNLGGPLPSDYSYLALAARVFPTKPMITDGKWELVGSQNTIVADRDGYLHFVVNEKTVDQHGSWRPDWLENNQGGFQVEVSVL